MDKKEKHKLGDRELDVMQILWESGSSTVGEMHRHLVEQGEDIAYTTIQTLLNRLEAKAYVKRETTENPYRYYPVLKESEVVGKAIMQLADRFFKDSTEKLMVHLVEKELKDDQLARIQELIDAQRRRGKK